MKKTILFAMMAAVLGFTACSKEEPAQTETVRKGMVLHATVSQSDDTRASFTDNEGVWHFDYTERDQITVTNKNIDTYYTFTYNGTDFISTDAEPTSEPARWYAYYPSKDVSFVGQTGKWDDLANVYALVGSTPDGDDETGEDGLNITMYPKCAVLKIINQKGSIDINVKHKDNGYWIKGLKDSQASFVLTLGETKQTFLSTTEAGTFYVAVPAGTPLIVYDGDKVIRSTTKGLTAGKYYELTIALPTFTVTFDTNGHGTAPESLIGITYGSKINKPSDPVAEGSIFAGWYKDETCTKAWDFGSDVVTANIILYAGWVEGVLSGKFSVSETKKVYFSKGNLWRDDDGSFHFENNQYDYNSGDYDANHVSHFMWSKDTVVSCALTYNDSSASESDVFFTNADQITPNPDFTANGQKGLWRILSKNEWIYLINQNGCLCTTIDGINGLIIFCDGYSGSRSGLTEIPYGCAFLPAAGSRVGNNGSTNVLLAGSLGYYWSASPIFDYYAHALYFNSGNVDPSYLGTRTQAYAVRLVTECQSEPSAE